MSATLGHSIQINARQTGVPKQDMLSLSEIDDMIRVGYCLRVIDEVAGEDPDTDSLGVLSDLERTHEMFSGLES